MANCAGGYDALVLLSALVSVRLARDLTPDQLELLSAFFEMLGDNLAFLALCPGGENSGNATSPGTVTPASAAPP